MINLLSNEDKRELRAARRNIVLLNYVLTLLMLAVLVASTYAIGYFLLHQQEQASRQKLTEFVPQKSEYKDTIDRANAYSKDLSIAKSILQNEFFYSDFMTLIAKTLPANTVMTSLDISASEVTKPVTIEVSTKSYQDFVAIKNALQNSKFFQGTKILTVDFVPEASYSYTGTMETTFNRAEFIKAQKGGTL